VSGCAVETRVLQSKRNLVQQSPMYAIPVLGTRWLAEDRNISAGPVSIRAHHAFHPAGHTPHSRPAKLSIRPTKLRLAMRPVRTSWRPATISIRPATISVGVPASFWIRPAGKTWPTLRPQIRKFRRMDTGNSMNRVNCSVLSREDAAVKAVANDAGRPPCSASRPKFPSLPAIGLARRREAVGLVCQNLADPVSCWDHRGEVMRRVHNENYEEMSTAWGTRSFAMGCLQNRSFESGLSKSYAWDRSSDYSTDWEDFSNRPWGLAKAKAMEQLGIDLTAAALLRKRPADF